MRKASEITHEIVELYNAILVSEIEIHQKKKRLKIYEDELKFFLKYNGMVKIK